MSKPFCSFKMSLDCVNTEGEFYWVGIDHESDQEVEFRLYCEEPSVDGEYRVTMNREQCLALARVLKMFGKTLEKS